METHKLFLPQIGVGPTAAPPPVMTPEEELWLLLHEGQQRPTMVWDDKLAAVARSHAKDMAEKGYFSHIDLAGVWPNQRVRESGYVLPADWRNDANYVESICAGQETAAQAWQGWMQSDVHRTHLLGLTPFFAAQTHLGIGLYEIDGSTYWWYWCVVSAPPES